MLIERSKREAAKAAGSVRFWLAAAVGLFCVGSLAGCNGASEPPAVESAPTEAPSAIEAITELLDQGRFAEAARMGERYTRERPDDADGWYLLGCAYHYDQKPGHALVALRSSFELEPSPAVAALLADLLQRGHRRREAIDVLERELALRPNNAALLARQGRLYREEGNLTLAMERLRRAVDLDPKRVEDWAVLVQLLTVARDLPAARAELARLKAAVGDHPAVWLWTGQLALLEGDTETALAQISRCATADPHSAAFQLDLGRALMAAGRYEEARVALQRAIELEPDLEQAHYQLAMACRALMDVGCTQRALAAHQMLKGRDRTRWPLLDAGTPVYAVARTRLAIAALADGATAEALEHAEAAYKQQRGVPGLATVLARAALAVDNATRGLEVLAPTEGEQGALTDYHLLMAQLLDALGQETAARERRALACAMDPARCAEKGQ